MNKDECFICREYFGPRKKRFVCPSKTKHMNMCFACVIKWATKHHACPQPGCPESMDYLLPKKNRRTLGSVSLFIILSTCIEWLPPLLTWTLPLEWVPWVFAVIIRLYSIFAMDTSAWPRDYDFCHRISVSLHHAFSCAVVTSHVLTMLSSNCAFLLSVTITVSLLDLVIFLPRVYPVDWENPSFRALALTALHCSICYAFPWYPLVWVPEDKYIVSSHMVQVYGLVFWFLLRHKSWIISFVPQDLQWKTNIVLQILYGWAAFMCHGAAYGSLLIPCDSLFDQAN